MGSILYVIGAVLVVLWIIGFFFAHVASPLIHAILVIAVIVFLYQFITGRRKI